MRPTKAIVSLRALGENLKIAANRSPGSSNVAVVKANGYGHGARAIASALEPDVDAFAVAFMDEAVELREAGILRPVLILEGCDHRQEVEEAAARDFWLMTHSRRQVDWIQSARLKKPVSAWIKIDTGMHRLGFDREETGQVVRSLAGSENVDSSMVLCTHLSCADDSESAETARQIEEFQGLARPYRLPVSIANSAGILYWPGSHAQWNRPGYMLYGNSPGGESEIGAEGLQPAMQVISEVVAVRQLSIGEAVGYGQRWRATRPSVIATVPIGYADGYPRHAPDGTPVLVRGQRSPLVGTVSMDMITVDVTDVEGIKVGDQVELWGSHLSVNEVAACAGTIGYELLAGLTGRVPITYRP